MQELPIYISLFFGAIALVSIVWFYCCTQSSKLLLILCSWTLFQSVLAVAGVYQDTDALPPRIMLFGIFPTLVAIIVTFSTAAGRQFVDSIDLQALTYFHSIRIPVEICLTLLFHFGVISVYTTMEGSNFDIISGLSAPFVAYFCFRKSQLPRQLLIGWNILCLLLLFNVVITAVFAFPSPFQQLAFDQPNIAPLYFPFNLLPTLVVPLVLFSHLIALRQLFRHSK